MDIVPLDLKLNLCISILEFKFLFLLKNFLIITLDLCISILEFKSCSFNREWAYHKIYVFLYQNLNRNNDIKVLEKLKFMYFYIRI